MQADKPTMQQIRKAICQHHGGLSDASDYQIQLIWDLLPPSVQERYLQDGANNTGKEVANADAL
ncbi:MAG TPA: hypothetical protein PK052_06850 [Anaerohalosphaeraceae bacterium]|nr:hypothetical protein [Anaerohalosphaeraceae bacterium]HOL31685.1 hypothetical protein [Anaerohalosphaeraceae bacterium]